MSMLSARPHINICSVPLIKQNGKNISRVAGSTITMSVPCQHHFIHKLNALQTETKESKWDMPDELLLVLEKVEKEKQEPAAA